MSQQFAKLFHFDDIGQVLVTIDETEESGQVGPDIHVSFMPPNLGVCAVKFGQFADTSSEAWDRGEEAFSNIDEEFAYKTAKKVIDEMSEVFKEEAQ